MKPVTFAEAQKIGVEKRAAIEAAKQEKINQEKNKLISEINSLKTILSQKDLDINKKSEIINNIQKNIVALKDNTINQLNQNISEKNNIIIVKDKEISALKANIIGKDNEINAFKTNIVSKDNEINALKANVVDKDREILNLSSENDKLNNLVKEKNQTIEELNLKIIENTDILTSKEEELLKYIEDEFVRIDINEQEDQVILGDSE